eukprot:9140543-Heterocapsa_arctica.AAC.1
MAAARKGSRATSRRRTRRTRGLQGWRTGSRTPVRKASEAMYRRRGSVNKSNRNSVHEQGTRDWRTQSRHGRKLLKEEGSHSGVRAISK